MEWNFKYSYSLDNEHFSCEYDSVEEALADAKVEAAQEYPSGEIETVYIGHVCRFKPTVNAESVITEIQDDADNEADEVDCGYLEDVSLVDLNKLQEMLTETFNKWAKETGNKPNFFTVENVKEYSLEEVENGMEL